MQSSTTPTTIIRPKDLVELLHENLMIVEEFKTCKTIPMESIPELKDHQKSLLVHPQIPESSHAQDHFFSYNEEQVQLVHDVLKYYNGIVDKEFERNIGHGVKESKMVTFGTTTICQLMIHLNESVYSRRVWLTPSFNLYVHLTRRHAKTPSVDFYTPLNHFVLPYIEKVDTLVLTIWHEKDDTYTLGTCYAGDSFPGSTSNDGTGIMYKWYPNKESRKEDFESFEKMIDTKIPTLLDATSFQNLH